MGDHRIVHVDGVAFVLPAFESIGSIRKIGRFAVFGNLAFDRFGFGVQILEAGALVQFGPAMIGVTRFSRQIAAFDRLARLTETPNRKGSE